MAYLTITLTVFFVDQKFLILMKSSLLIISIMDHAFGVEATTSSLHLRSSRFYPILFSRNVIVLHFLFRSVFHFEPIFGEGYEACVHIHFLALGCPVVPTSFTEKTIFALLYCLLLCQLSVDYIDVGLFPGSPFCSIDLFV